MQFVRPRKARGRRPVRGGPVGSPARLPKRGVKIAGVSSWYGRIRSREPVGLRWRRLGKVFGLCSPSRPRRQFLSCFARRPAVDDSLPKSNVSSYRSCNSRQRLRGLALGFVLFVLAGPTGRRSLLPIDTQTSGQSCAGIWKNLQNRLFGPADRPIGGLGYCVVLEE